MMIRALTVSLLLAVMAAPAYAQDSDPETPPATNPQTRQTDQSEDDYRRSQRRRDTGDIFDDIGINQGSTGSGGILGREVKAIDRLDQESRRHLNKQRAKALAEAEPGEPIDAAYEPSEAAKTDEYTARQEANAWEEMMEEANSGLSGTTGQSGGQGGDQGQPPPGDPGQSPDQAASGQAGSGPSGMGQSGVGQSSGEGDSQTRPNSSPLRGGSASSASSILDRIKGRGGNAAQSGTTPSSTENPANGQSSESQVPQGQTEEGETQESQPQATETQTDVKADTQAATKAAAEADARTQAQDAAQDAAAAPNEAAEAAAHHETMSPLERLKRDPVERDDTGGRTSASDYLKRKKD